MKTCVLMTKNEKTTLYAFAKDEVREDHFLGMHGIYKYSAHFDKIGDLNIFNRYNIEETETNISNALKMLKRLPHKPERIFIYDDSIEVAWHPLKTVLVNSKEDYLKLSLDFVRFLDSIDIIEFDIQLGSFDDDPDFFYGEYDKSNNKRQIVFEDAFGNSHNGIISVYDVRKVRNYNFEGDFLDLSNIKIK